MTMLRVTKLCVTMLCDKEREEEKEEGAGCRSKNKNPTQ